MNSLFCVPILSQPPNSHSYPKRPDKLVLMASRTPWTSPTDPKGKPGGFGLCAGLTVSQDSLSARRAVALGKSPTSSHYILI